MTLAYFDCFNGAGGDMIVASLIDAGADPQALKDQLSSLKVEGYTLAIERVNKQGFAATKFLVDLDRTTPQPHRHLKDILSILEKSTLEGSIRDRAAQIFTRLAQAEAKVHGTDINKVHFHEVGAVDAIVDVVGALIALDLLNVDRVVCSPLPVGSGIVHCDHGAMPIPAPATAELLIGVPLAKTDETGELVTPTAAAVLTTLAESFDSIPAMTVQSLGYGAGTRDGKHRPNLLRVLIGQESAQSSTDSDLSDEITILETNLDDTTPEIVGYCMDKLLSAGALDVYTVPIQMKKSRPGVVLTILCESGKLAALERIVFAETTTLGIRKTRAMRTKLLRRIESVSTPYGDIRIKIGEREGVQTASPEFDDCKAAAVQHGVPLREVMAAASAAFTATNE